MVSKNLLMDIKNYSTGQMLTVDGYVKVRDAFCT